jgi:hypothetical protein
VFETMQRQRRPGDQAPPPRPTHRNDHIRTATTHVKDTSGTFEVHDGADTIVTLGNGQLATGLSYDEARKAKDYAVTKLKFRRAGIRPTSEQSPTPIELDPPLADPQLEANRQKALAAARKTAQEAQARANAAKAKRQQPAPGWEPPPPGVSSAGKASAGPAQQQHAPGWEKATKAAVVELDELPGEGEEVELDADAADLLVNTDMDADVKQETERAHVEAKKLWDSIPAESKDAVLVTLKSLSDATQRDTILDAMTEEQRTNIETIEIAYNLLFPVVKTP